MHCHQGSYCKLYYETLQPWLTVAIIFSEAKDLSPTVDDHFYWTTKSYPTATMSLIFALVSAFQRLIPILKRLVSKCAKDYKTRFYFPRKILQVYRFPSSTFIKAWLSTELSCLHRSVTGYIIGTNLVRHTYLSRLRTHFYIPPALWGI